MPDQNNPTDTNLNPPQVNPPSEPTQMPQTPPLSDFPPPPPMDIPTEDASIPPPFPPETTPIEGAAPPDMGAGSAAPSFDIPPVVTPFGKPKGGGKKVIATILGLLVLVGGLGAGIILVRQQQDIREKAAVIDCVGEGGTCYPTNYTCSDNITIGTNCPSGKKCSFATCTAPTSAPAPTQSAAPQPAPSGATSCTRITTTPRRASGTSLTVTSSDLDNCQRGTACRDGSLWATKYTCNGINLSQGCQDNGIILDDPITAQEIVDGKTFQVGSLNCGTVQIDVGCKNTAGTYGNVAFLVESAATACATPPPAGAGPTAQCLNIKAFDTNWTELTSTQLAEFKPGDKVRFTVAGQASSGNFDKARFKINGVQKPEVTGKRPGTEEYFDEYTIPEGITTFSINAQIHHSTLGWSN